MRISVQILPKSSAESLKIERTAREKAAIALFFERQEEANTLAEAEAKYEAKYKALQDEFYELQ